MSYNLTTMQSIFLNNKEITLIKHNNKTVYQKAANLPAANEIWYTSTNNTLINLGGAEVCDENNNPLSLIFHGVDGDHCVIRYSGNIHHINTNYESFISSDGNLLTITFSNYYSEAYSWFIQNCPNLTAINFGDNTNSQLYGIGNSSFSDNPSLTSIIIPPSLDKVWEGYSFKNCGSLNYIEMRASHFDTTSWGDYFEYLFADMGVAPGGTFKLYQDNDKYSMFVQQFTNYGWNIVNL